MEPCSTASYATYPPTQSCLFYCPPLTGITTGTVRGEMSRSSGFCYKQCHCVSCKGQTRYLSISWNRRTTTFFMWKIFRWKVVSKTSCFVLWLLIFQPFLLKEWFDYDTGKTWLTTLAAGLASGGPLLLKAASCHGWISPNSGDLSGSLRSWKQPSMWRSFSHIWTH